MKMRASFEVTTGKMIEAQCDAANAVVMLQNAINAGYAENDVEVRLIDGAEFDALMRAANPPSAPADPVLKLKAFLANNPDVAVLL